MKSGTLAGAKAVQQFRTRVAEHEREVGAVRAVEKRPRACVMSMGGLLGTSQKGTGNSYTNL